MARTPTIEETTLEALISKSRALGAPDSERDMWFSAELKGQLRVTSNGFSLHIDFWTWFRRCSTCNEALTTRRSCACHRAWSSSRQPKLHLWKPMSHVAPTWRAAWAWAAAEVSARFSPPLRKTSERGSPVTVR